VIFETDDPAKGWDGLFKGLEMNTGVYAWFVNAESKSAEAIVLKGNVNLIR